MGITKELLMGVMQSNTWDQIFPWHVMRDGTPIYRGDSEKDCQDFLANREDLKELYEYETYLTAIKKYQIIQNENFDKRLRYYMELLMEHTFKKSGVDREDRTLRIFISQPMHGVKEDEYIKVRQDAIRYLKEKYGKIEIVDNYHHDGAPENAGRLWYLGQSISLLDTVDAVYFVNDADSNGCKVERKICELYNILVLD